MKEIKHTMKGLKNQFIIAASVIGTGCMGFTASHFITRANNVVIPIDKEGFFEKTEHLTDEQREELARMTYNNDPIDQLIAIYGPEIQDEYIRRSNQMIQDVTKQPKAP